MQLVPEKLADRTDTTVTEVVAVIDVSLTVFDLDDVLNGVDDIFVCQNRDVLRYVDAQLVVHLHTADARQIVTLRVEEELVYEGFCRLFRNRLARTHHFIDTDRGEIVLIFDIFRLLEQFQRINVGKESVDDRAVDAFGEVVGNHKLGDAGFGHLLQFGLVDSAHRVEKHFTRLRVDDRFREVALRQCLDRVLNRLQTALDQFLRFFGAQAFSGSHENVALRVYKIILQTSAEVFGAELHEELVLFDLDGLQRVEELQDILLAVTQGTEHNGNRHFTALVDTHVKDIFRIILEVEP